MGHFSTSPEEDRDKAFVARYDHVLSMCQIKRIAMEP
jgi:hypothetical protein